MPGEQTRRIVTDLLGFDADEAERLIDEGILFAP
jgi:hypothetical protein